MCQWRHQVLPRYIGTRPYTLPYVESAEQLSKQMSQVQLLLLLQIWSAVIKTNQIIQSNILLWPLFALNHKETSPLSIRRRVQLFLPATRTLITLLSFLYLFSIIFIVTQTYTSMILSLHHIFKLCQLAFSRRAPLLLLICFSPKNWKIRLHRSCAYITCWTTNCPITFFVIYACRILYSGMFTGLYIFKQSEQVNKP